MRPREFDPALPELMDLPQEVSRELEVDLENLVGINRHFGSHRLIRHFLRRWFKPGETYRALDLCTASGDIPRLMVDWAAQHGVSLTVEAVDFQPATLEIARRLSARYPQIVFRQGDAREIDGAAGAYDFVFCSLALHHFSEADAVQILRRCRELASRAALVADLERGWLAAAGVWLMTEVLYREPMTKFDARLSVRRAFSYGELAALAKRAGWEDFRQARFAIARQAVWLEKPAGNGDGRGGPFSVSVNVSPG
jgi:2-polyprenyl-3-methyl-5-hydroxy-6-metoxy-1,4-benzoquinol methylase